MRVKESGVGIKVGTFRLSQVEYKAPVETLNVLCDAADHRFPVWLLRLVDVPSLFRHITAAFRQDASVVHHLLRDTANIDAGAAETPLGASWRWLDKVGQGYSLAHLCASGSSRDATTASTNDEDVIVVLRTLLCLLS